MTPVGVVVTTRGRERVKTRAINYEYDIHLIFGANILKNKPRVKKNNYSLISFNFLFHFFGYSGILLNLVCGVVGKEDRAA